MFRIPYGDTVYRMDFSQIKAQCSAHMTDSDKDAAFASQKFGVPPENITPTMRQAAKKLRPWKNPNWQQAKDVYTYIASEMFGVPEENITPVMRTAAKNQHYRELYS